MSHMDNICVSQSSDYEDPSLWACDSSDVMMGTEKFSETSIYFC